MRMGTKKGGSSRTSHTSSFKEEGELLHSVLNCFAVVVINTLVSSHAILFILSKCMSCHVMSYHVMSHRAVLCPVG